MFCPRLDSALVASIYSDLGDFKACIPILSALAAAASPTGIDSSASTITFNTTSNPSSNNPSKASITSQPNNMTPSGSPSKNRGSKTASNEKNILIWSEGVANSNTSSTPSHFHKQGQVVHSSSQQTASTNKATTQAAATSKASFKAVRNPAYLKKMGLTEAAVTAAAMEDVIDDDDADANQPIDEEGTEQALSEETPSTHSHDGPKSAKKNRRQKRSERIEKAHALVSDSAPLSTPRRTWKKDENGQHTAETDLADQFTDLSVSNTHLADGGSEDEAVAQIMAYEAAEYAAAQGRQQAAPKHQNGDGVKAEELEFLKSCFPDQEHSDEYLTQVLKDCRRDLEAAVELILSQMFLENEQVETSSSGSGSLLSSSSSHGTHSTTTSSLDDSFYLSPQKTKKKAKGHGGGASWGTRHPSAHKWDAQNDALLTTMDRQDEFFIPESNEWATFEHQISILMNIFHTVPQKIIVSEYHANGTNLLQTVDSLEKRLKSENQHGSARGRERQSQFDMNLAQLIELFPDHSAAGLKRMLVYNGGHVQDAMNAVLAADIARGEQKELASISTASPSSSSKRPHMVPFQADIRFADKNAVPKPSSTGHRLKSLPSTNNPFPSGPRPFPNTLLDKANTELYNDDDDPVWCRQRAQETLEQRNELFRKAARAYKGAKNKGAGMGGIAAYYADEGKKLDVQGKQWHMRAARAVVQQHRLESNDPNLVDLHGLTIAEAQTVVKEAVTQWFSRATMQANRIAAKPLKIVCGVGSHSKDRIARLYPTILSLLMKDGWRCEAENGVIVVKGVSRIMPSTPTRK
ncbi:hypothetical protein BGZ70_004325 [Mortierella alpina]|uniref:Smr domain-containing protein n=1 Tax=Mortierella alpina TaxID=64518 RepID=A0A9P6M4V8_MORAP|nr:hypothetical protein BGZ70_004325 [Mortierella alpina]